MPTTFDEGQLDPSMATEAEVSAAIAAKFPVSVSDGGTGQTSTPTNGQIPIGNGTNFTLGTLTQGSGVTITNGPGTITISATGGGGITQEESIVNALIFG
jgi:hypothetical protein